MREMTPDCVLNFTKTVVYCHLYILNPLDYPTTELDINKVSNIRYPSKAVASYQIKIVLSVCAYSAYV